jgi:hypothetical protein
MAIKASKQEVLKTLKENLQTHGKIVREARGGYVEKARKALEKRLSQIKEGNVVALHFELRPPMDYSNVYRTAIKCLELHQEEIIELTSEQVRHLVNDDWDWMDDFLAVNSAYSGTALETSRERGI